MMGDATTDLFLQAAAYAKTKAAQSSSAVASQEAAATQMRWVFAGGAGILILILLGVVYSRRSP